MTGVDSQLAGGLQSAAPTPEDFGLVTWNADPSNAQGTALLNANNMYGQLCFTRTAKRWSQLNASTTVAGATLTAGGNGAVVADMNGNVLLTTADMTTQWAAGNGNQPMPFTAPAILPAGTYKVYFLARGVTTPTFRTGYPFSSFYIGDTAGTPRVFVNGTNNLALPAVGSVISPAGDVTNLQNAVICFTVS